jgi:hypothetical protein
VIVQGGCVEPIVSTVRSLEALRQRERKSFVADQRVRSHETIDHIAEKCSRRRAVNGRELFSAFKTRVVVSFHNVAKGI